MGESNHHHQQYLVTRTTAQMASAFKRIGLKIPDDNFFMEMDNSLIDSLKANLSDQNIDVIDMDFCEVCDEIISYLHSNIANFGNVEVISTSPLIAYESGGICLEVNRLVDLNGNLIGLGPRPGFPSILEQIKKIRKRSVVIIEDGAFTGKTMEFIVNCLAKRGIATRAIIMGILFPQAATTLTQNSPIEVIALLNFSANLIEWMPTHDFIPFFPNSGRVIGNFIGDNCFPIYLHNSFSLSNPYILPYCDAKDWASLSPGKKEVAFSQNCMKLAIDFFKEVGKINGKEIKTENLRYCYPAISLPVTQYAEQKNAPFGSCRSRIFGDKVLEILNEDFNNLNNCDEKAGFIIKETAVSSTYALT